MAGSWLQLCRALIPSWRFFDWPESEPLLEVRYAKVDLDFGPWKPRLPPIAGQRSLVRLFVNAEENHLLACQSLLQQLQHDFARGDTESVSASLVENLALNSFPGDPLAVERATAARIQYRVTFPNKQVFLSPEHQVGVKTAKAPG